MLTNYRNVLGIFAALAILAGGNLAHAQGAKGDAENPVVRAVGGLWGIQFSFGGLATMTTTNDQLDQTGMVISQVGMRMVRSENIIIPLFFGFGTSLVNPPGDDNEQANIGVRVGGGLEYHFRIWRRISPFVGGYGFFSYGNPTGPKNWLMALALQPTLGVEYYWGDRVSFIAQYFFSLDFQYLKQGEEGRTTLGMATNAGGQLSVVFYF